MAIETVGYFLVGVVADDVVGAGTGAVLSLSLGGWDMTLPKRCCWLGPL